jgi:uncharacterized cupin superfamily protein
MVESRGPIVNVDELVLRDIRKGSRYEARLSRVGALIGAEQLGAQYHVVAPGKAAFPRHAHHSNEEMFVVLSGTGEYQQGQQTWSIRAGDVISAPAGEGDKAHQVRNTGNEPLTYLAVSTRHDPDVTEYPDSGKFMVASRIPKDKGMASAKVGFSWNGASKSVDYWDGEDFGEEQ